MKCEDPGGCDALVAVMFVEEYDYHFCSLEHLMNWVKETSYPCDSDGKQVPGGKLPWES